MRIPFAAANATSLSAPAYEKMPGAGSMVSHFISFSGVSESKLCGTSVRTRGSSRRPLISAVPTRRCAASAAGRMSATCELTAPVFPDSGVGVAFWMRHDAAANAGTSSPSARLGDLKWWIVVAVIGITVGSRASQHVPQDAANTRN